jgi:membrane protein YdbS with pleckstrin-like domain
MGAVMTAPTMPAERKPAESGVPVSQEPERELWSGTFSPKGMYGSWAIAAVITVVGIILAVLIPLPPVLIAVSIAVPVIWVVLAVTLLSRRLGVSYTVTSQRFLHQRGVLRRVHNRILLIDIEDVSFVQGLMDRMFNVGTITLISTDVSDGKLIMPGIDNVEHVANLIDDARREERRKRAIILQQHDHPPASS